MHKYKHFLKIYMEAYGIFFAAVKHPQHKIFHFNQF